MEEVLLRLLEVRKSRLHMCIESSERASADGISLDDASSTIIRLKEYVQKLECEIRNYTGTSPQPRMDVVEAALEVQLQGEDLILKLEDAVRELRETSQERTKPDQTLYSTKLPKLELPKFNGDKLRWSEFWDRFESSVHTKKIIEADKLTYLLGCLESTALEAVAGLTITNRNYTIAIQTLKSRFGSNSHLIDAHYSALNNISRCDYNAHSCRKTLDEIERHLRVLEKLGEDTRGNHLRGIILGKFPEKIVHQYHLTKQQDDTISTIRTSLEKIIMAMEMSQGVNLIGEQSTTLNDIPGSSTTEALQVRTQTKPNPIWVKENRTKLKQTRKRKGGPISSEPYSKRKRFPCLFCNLKNHNSADCRRVQNIDERKKKLVGRCLNCLRRNHKTPECTRKISCFSCKGRHLQLLCPQYKGENMVSKFIDCTSCHMVSHTQFTFLQTAVAQVKNPDNNSKLKPCRLILDSGSQRSYITARMEKTLKLSAADVDLLLVYTFGASTPKEMKCPLTNIVIKTKRGISKVITVNIVPHITERLPIAKLKSPDIDIPADDDSVGEKVDLLIGNDYYSSFMRESKIKFSNLLFAVDSDFGWILSGNTSQDQDNRKDNVLTVTTYCHCHNSDCPYFTEPDLPLRNIDIKFLWTLECIGITDPPKATRQEEAVKHFNDTIQYDTGRYEVKWPWVEYPPQLPDNFGLALGRLKSLTKRLSSDLLKEYDAILREQLDLNIIEAAEENDSTFEHPVHYLPHHMVKQDGKRGRIVYDASAKTNGNKSLNECLYSGPSMLEDLTGLLLKFRTKRIGIVADVEKAFLQIGLQTEDRDVTRFLWLKDISKEPSYDNLLFLRFCRVPFGVISSPFLLTATIRYHMNQSDERLVKEIASNCYVDNLVTGAHSLQEAQLTYDKTNETFKQLSMNIRDWVSNDMNFTEYIPIQQRAKEPGTVKLLGLHWNTQNDTLKLNITENHFNVEASPDTKRKVLRSLARIYDPCGFVCPLVLPLKLLFREICEQKLKWDSSLPVELIQSLTLILQDLRDAMQVELPRYIGLVTSASEPTYELHCFSDASKYAYAAVTYVVARNQQHSTVSFIMGKSRIAKNEKESELKIPKLELLGFLIASRLLKYVREQLKISINKEFLWTDSLIVLGWMNSKKLLPPFVANRVEEIKRNQSQAALYYVNTKLNPADVATRPETWKQNKELWLNGPAFLKEVESSWPEDRHYETHTTLCSVGKALEQSPRDQHSMENRMYEDLENEVRVLELDDPPEPSASGNGGGDRDETCIIKKLQSQHFRDEMLGKSTQLSKNLGLFLDVDGLLRCRGRMTNTTWNYDMKHPILLPKQSDFTMKVIKETHVRNYHVGASHTLNLIRERYWIPKGKSQVQKVIKSCVQCVKHGGGPYRLPPTPALPAERVNYSPPFSYTGVDYFGPLYVKTSTGKAKRWVALFTCLAVRAIHLELVQDLTAEQCLLAIRRFAACRNTPRRIYSDNATYFKLTSEVMTQPYCVQKNIEWKFIPQLAPWHGGFYERLVGLVKHCLKRTLEKHLLNDSELLTVLKEIESVINSRPLTKVGTELIHILRPADFLSLGKCLITTPTNIEVPCAGTASKRDLIESWKKGLKLLEEFKRMFVNQYLVSLRERYQHGPKQPRIKSDRTPRIGDVVQIKSDMKNRENWKVGRVIELLKGTDGEYRVAKVKADDSVLIRSVGHLYPLEVDPASEIPEDVRITDSTLKVPVKYLNEDDMNELRVSSPIWQNKEDDSQQMTEMATTPLTKTSVHDNDMTEDVTTSELGHASAQTISDKVPVQEKADPVPENAPEKVETTEKRAKRDAAVRAGERILEWTRHLFTLLH